jgi:hypothetical protein
MLIAAFKGFEEGILVGLAVDLDEQFREMSRKRSRNAQHQVDSERSAIDLVDQIPRAQFPSASEVEVRNLRGAACTIVSAVADLTPNKLVLSMVLLDKT